MKWVIILTLLLIATQAMAYDPAADFTRAMERNDNKRFHQEEMQIQREHNEQLREIDRQLQANQQDAVMRDYQARKANEDNIAGEIIDGARRGR